MIRAGVVAAAVLLTACGNGGAAAADQRQAAQASAARLDVAGVRPGMSAGDAKTTLERAGWRTEAFPGKDWAAEVEYEAGRQRGKMVLDQPRKGIQTIQANKGDEELVISMQASPSGSIVSHVHYTAPMAGRTGEQVRAQMMQRYGQPTRQSRVGAPLIDMTWCTGGENCRSYDGVAKPALTVSEDVYHKLHIAMTEGVDAERARQTQLLAAAGGGASPKSSF